MLCGDINIMSIFVGRKNVVRRASIDTGYRRSVLHLIDGYVGVDGVVRRFIDQVDEIDHVEMNVFACKAEKISSGYETIDEGLSAINRYGSLALAEKAISLTCKTNDIQLAVNVAPYLVYLDGHKEQFIYFIDRNAASFTFSVTFFASSFSTGDQFTNSFFGFNFGRETKIFSGFDGNVGTARFGPGLTKVGSLTCTQTYNSLVIGGKNIPITTESSLK